MARQQGPSKTVAGYLSEMSEAQEECGAYGHKWPEIRRRGNPGNRMEDLPKGMQAGPIQQDGSFEIIERCLRGCGRARRSVTLPGGFYDMDMLRRYTQDQGKDWVTIPQEVRNASPVSRRVFAASIQNAFMDQLVAAARRAAQDQKTGS